MLKKAHGIVFKELSHEDAGKLIKGIFDYVNTGESNLESYLKVIFIPIKEEIDKNEEKYLKICERNKQNGLLGGRTRKSEDNPEEPRETQWDNLGPQENPKEPDTRHISFITNQEKDKKGVKGGKEEKTKVDDSNLYKKIIEHLNTQAEKKFKYTTKSTREKINARLNEGYKLNDFIVVIDKKIEEWLGTDFEKYLCPETLFGTKFEKYLNQPRKKNPEWLKENIRKEKLSEEEKAEMEEILKKYR